MDKLPHFFEKWRQSLILLPNGLGHSTEDNDNIKTFHALFNSQKGDVVFLDNDYWTFDFERQDPRSDGCVQQRAFMNLVTYDVLHLHILIVNDVLFSLTMTFYPYHLPEPTL